MTIKPDKGSTFLWFFMLISIPLVIYFFGDDDRESQFARIYLLCLSVSMLILSFTKAFSTYTLDYIGITQECVFFSRTFKWTDFKYIGVQRVRGGPARPSDWIRCSTVSLPKSMTKDEFEKKGYWRPSKTITISLGYDDKAGDELYQKFLSYCGGERDIRD